MFADFIIKVCGVTSSVDARTAVDAGANALGFNFHRLSPRYISPAQAAEIAATLPGDVLRVGVFVNAGVEDLLEIGAAVPLDVLQLHGTGGEAPGGYRVWRAIHISHGAMSEAIGTAEAYLLDSCSPGSGQVFDWNIARAFPHRMIVAGGLDGTNVAHAISALQPWGVDACSRLESSPGKKDAMRVRSFVGAARTAAAQQKLVTL